jgi:hypothetical protein
MALGKDVCAGLSISFAVVAGLDVCAIRIPKSPRAVYIAESGQTRFYVRTGNTTQELNPKEAVEYARGNWA